MKRANQPAIETDPQTMSAQILLCDVPHGLHAVSVRHDEHNSGKLEKNLVGIPTEGYGGSNNPEPKLRAPTLDEAKLSLKLREQSIAMRLVYC
jgi:uncharacterized protein (DUF2141 family)